MRENKEIPGSTLFVRKIIKKWKGEDGMIYMKAMWKEAQNLTNIGSCAKPNKEIIMIRYDVPSGKKNMLMSLFGEE